MTEIYCQVFHVMPKCYESVNVLIEMIYLLVNVTQKFINKSWSVFKQIKTY